MKKQNFNNSADGDDNKLISILKDSLGREPSEKFVENTFNELLISNEKQKISHRPLRSPLYMMLAIGLILFVPVFVTLSPNIYIPNLGFELNDFLKNMSFQLDSWYILSLLLLVLASTVVVWVELSVFKFRNPFV